METFLRQLVDRIVVLLDQDLANLPPVVVNRLTGARGAALARLATIDDGYMGTETN